MADNPSNPTSSQSTIGKPNTTTFQTGNNITSKEYEDFLAEREAVATKLQQANSEFMWQTYNQIQKVLDKRYLMAVKLNIKLEKAEARKLADEKRKTFQAGQAGKSTPR